MKYIIHDYTSTFYIITYNAHLHLFITYNRCLFSMRHSHDHCMYLDHKSSIPLILIPIVTLIQTIVKSLLFIHEYILPIIDWKR